MSIRDMSEWLAFDEGGYAFHELRGSSALDMAFRLRYAICVQRMGWVSDDGSERETDEWDFHAYHFGAYSGGTLVAYLRLVRDSSEKGIMSRKCFSYLFQKRDPRPRHAESGDISRLIIAPSHRHERADLSCILRGLYRLAYGRARIEGIRYWYFVTNRSEIRALRYGCRFPVRVLGGGRTPDGKINYIGFLDLVSARRWGRILAPISTNWFETAHKQTAP